MKKMKIFPSRNIVLRYPKTKMTTARWTMHKVIAI
jgi:hypothetical protein